MIEALIAIGKALRDYYPFPLIENPYPQGKGENAKVFIVELNTNDPSEIKITLSDFRKEDLMRKYFFRSPSSSQGPASSLSFKLPAKLSALKQRLGILEKLGYKMEISRIAESVMEKVQQLKDTGELPKNIKILIVLKIDGEWPAENKKLQEEFLKNFFEKLSSYKHKPLWRQEGICHGCGKKTTIYGGVGNLLKFYTVDKYGYAPKVNPSIAWKQYALCGECILDLERGKRAVDEFLTWRFYGKNFWLLPMSSEDLKNILEEFRDFYYRTSGKTHKEGFSSLEDELLYKASLQKDALSYHFVFISKENQALRILLHIEEILPSVIASYVETKRKVENHFNEIVFEAVNLKEKMRFNFFTSNNLKETQQKPGFSDEDFYMLVDKVFRRSPINEGYLISKAMLRIRGEMEGEGERGTFPIWAVLETLLSLEFLNEWGILKRKNGGVNMNGLPYESFFEQHGDFFNHPAKRALVLLGVLVQKFLDKQYRERGSTPFLKALKNLILDQKDVKKLYVALQNKMNEYDISHWWPELREGISLYFIEAGDRWPLSPEEIGFYIAIGMALHNHPVFNAGDNQEE